jgi:hypothetical protein
MKPRALTTSILLLIAGISFGWLAGSRFGPPPTADAVLEAEAALVELVAYRGLGARAARRTLELTDRIVAGGTVMVPKIEAAFDEVDPFHRYTSHGDQAAGIYEMDTRHGIISRYPNATVALCEALARIGNDEAIEVLKFQASKVRDNAFPINRTAAALFLSRWLDRSDVREFFTKLVSKFLVTQVDSPEAQRILDMVKGRLDPSIADRLEGAFINGWARDEMEDRIAANLAAIDRERAASLFLRLLGEETKPRQIRGAAARNVARLPEKRRAATDLLVRDPNHYVANDFIRGLRRGRFGEVWLWRDATESGDREKVKAYDLERLPRLKETLGIFRELATALGQEKAQAIDLPKRIAEYEELIGKVERKYGVPK